MKSWQVFVIGAASTVVASFGIATLLDSTLVGVILAGVGGIATKLLLDRADKISGVKEDEDTESEQEA